MPSSLLVSTFKIILGIGNIHYDRQANLYVLLLFFEFSFKVMTIRCILKFSYLIPCPPSYPLWCNVDCLFFSPFLKTSFQHKQRWWNLFSPIHLVVKAKVWSVTGNIIPTPTDFLVVCPCRHTHTQISLSVRLFPNTSFVGFRTQMQYWWYRPYWLFYIGISEF